MATPHQPEIAEVWRRVEPLVTLLDEQLGRINADSFVASHRTGTVEVAVNGHMRLTALNIDPRILSLGAQEVATRINETLTAATDYAADSIDRDVTDVAARVMDALVELQDTPPAV